MSPLRNAVRSAAGRRSATVFVLTCGILAVTASAAFANHVAGVTANGCSSLTYSYAGFHNFPSNTINMTVLDADGTTVNNTATGSFSGPSGTTTIPIVGGYDGEVLIPQATWNTNGSVGSYNTTKPYTTITLSCPVTYTGDAYNLRASASLLGVVTLPPLTINEVGSLSTMSAESLSHTILSENLPLLSLTGAQLVSSVTTGSDASTASTSVNGLALDPLSVVAITTGEIQSTSTTTCDVSTQKDGFAGTTNIASLVIGSTNVVGTGGIVPAGPIPANTVISLGPLGSVTLNEQIKTADSLTVNAIDISLLTNLGLGSVNVIIGHAESDVEGC